MNLFHHSQKKFLNKLRICTNEKKIAIIGAGIAGLTAANLLKLILVLNLLFMKKKKF